MQNAPIKGEYKKISSCVSIIHMVTSNKDKSAELSDENFSVLNSFARIST